MLISLTLISQKHLFRLLKRNKLLNSNYSFRYNELSERIEVKPGEQGWRDFDDRELNDILTRMHASNIKVSKDNLNTYVNSGVFSVAYNPVVGYVDSLKPWKRRVDYIRQVFQHLHLEDDADTEFLFECFKLWFVCMVYISLFFNCCDKYNHII